MKDFKEHLLHFFYLSNQAKWTRRQITERIEKEWERWQTAQIAKTPTAQD